MKTTKVKLAVESLAAPKPGMEHKLLSAGTEIEVADISVPVLIEMGIIRPVDVSEPVVDKSNTTLK